MTVTVFGADTRVENWLRSLDIDFTGPVPVPLDSFDFRASKANQARDEALVDEAVENYSQAIKSGDILPAVVTYRRGGRYVLIDGVNRLEAARKEGVDSVFVYEVLGCSSETIQFLTATANSSNGYAVDRAWKLQQSIQLMAIGWPIEKVSKGLHLPVNSILRHQKMRDGDARARTLRIQGWGDLSNKHREILSRLRLDSTLSRVAEVVSAANVSANQELASFVTTVNKIANEAEAVAHVQAWGADQLAHARELQRMGRKRHVANPKTGILTGLGKVANFDVRTVNISFATDADRSALSQRCRETIAHLVRIESKLHDPDVVLAWVLDNVEEMLATEGD